MDIYFQDPSDVPLPPEETRIRELNVHPFPDQSRVRISIEITPFQQKPNLEIRVISNTGEEAASLSIIEAIDRKMEFTVHLKGEPSPGEYFVNLDLYYFKADPTSGVGETGSAGEIHQLPERDQPVDQRQAKFDF